MIITLLYLIIEKTLEVQEKLLPSNHHQVVFVYICMASTYKSLDRYSDALQLLSKAPEIEKNTLRTEHPKIVEINT